MGRQPMSASLIGRYNPPLARLLERRRNRIVDAALRFGEAHVQVREARLEHGRGTPECREAVRKRAEAKDSLFYHVREFHRENA